MLPTRSDVVVIGGGVTGAAALHYLVELGCRDVLLIERHTLASGSTGRCAGGVRTLFSDELNRRIGEESIRRLERFPDEVGVELDLRLPGYLFLLDDPDDARRFAGDGAEMVTPAAAREAVPQLEVGDLVAAAFDRRAGYLTPDLVVQGYVRAAAAGGARVVQSCAATRIVASGGRVTAVETTGGLVATERVVLAAGVWSTELHPLPVERERRLMFFTDDAPAFPAELPLTIDFATGFYFHREGAGLAFGGREQSLEELAPVAAGRVPAIAGLGIRSTWWGWYEMSPDHNALVGAAADPEGLVYATGFSGHGFQQGPVVGEHLAELVLGVAPTFDLSRLSVERFASGAVRVERNVV
ncbi:MAG TPA: FAD-binding oxidoreductase [Gaiellaceae bacterium]